MSQGLGGGHSTIPGGGPGEPGDPLASEAAFAAALDVLVTAIFDHATILSGKLGFSDHAADIAVEVMLTYQGRLRAAHEAGDHTLFNEMRRAPRLTRWVARAVMRRGLNWRKKDEADMRHDVGFHAVQELRESPFEDPGQFAERRDIHRLVEAKLARMSDDHRKVIALRITEHSWDEVVEITGIPMRTAKRYEEQVLKRLRIPSIAQYKGWERGSQPVPQEEDDTP